MLLLLEALWMKTMFISNCNSGIPALLGGLVNRRSGEEVKRRFFLHGGRCTPIGDPLKQRAEFLNTLRTHSIGSVPIYLNEVTE